jgi:hypothetical protein
MSRSMPQPLHLARAQFPHGGSALAEKVASGLRPTREAERIRAELFGAVSTVISSLDRLGPRSGCCSRLEHRPSAIHLKTCNGLPRSIDVRYACRRRNDLRWYR